MEVSALEREFSMPFLLWKQQPSVPLANSGFWLARGVNLASGTGAFAGLNCDASLAALGSICKGELVMFSGEKRKNV